MKYEKFSYMPINIYYKTWFIGLPLRIKNLVISYKQRKLFHLMDDVVYQRKICFINNGTRYSNEGIHLWDICEKKIKDDGTRNSYAVSESELYRPFTWFNFWNARLFHYKWYMSSWYSIDVNKKLQATTQSNNVL